MHSGLSFLSTGLLAEPAPLKSARSLSRYRGSVPPDNWRSVKSHPIYTEFIQAHIDHLKSHELSHSWEEVDAGKAKGSKILGCQRVHSYKADSDGILKAYKARLVVCGNQQGYTLLTTRAFTASTCMISRSKRATMLITMRNAAPARVLASLFMTFG